jgi:predicted GIY-YIG superfamily endonuclease
MKDLIRRILLEERIKWTKEMIQDIVSKYEDLNDFRTSEWNAYNAAKRNGWLPEIVLGLNRKHKIWTFDELKKISEKYNKPVDFKQNDKQAYDAAVRRGWINDLTKNMTGGKGKSLSKDEIQKIAYEYSSRRAFELGNKGAYTQAQRKGWLSDVTKHMTYLGNQYKRLVYLFKFNDNSVYVGLTHNKDDRYMSHLTSPNSAVFRHIQKTGLQPEFEVISDDYIDVQDAANLEVCKIQEYRDLGYNVLNTMKGGGLGGCTRKWTKEIISSLASNYTTLLDFKKNEKRAYDACVQNGWIDELLGHLERKLNSWDKDTVLKMASQYQYLQDFKKDNPSTYRWVVKNNLVFELLSFLKQKPKEKKWSYENLKQLVIKYNSVNEFKKDYPGAYSAILKNGWLDELTNHMVRQKRTGNITLEMVLNIAKKYDTISNFKKNDKNTYALAQYHGWLPEVTKHLVRKKTIWSYDKVKEIADKFNTIKDFYTSNPNAYAAAKNNGWMNDVTKHMNKTKTKWTYEDFIRLSQPYDKKIDFKKAQPKLYQVAYKWGWLKDKYK